MKKPPRASARISIVRAATDAYFEDRARYRSILASYGEGVTVDWDRYRREAIADIQGFDFSEEVIASAVDEQIARLRKFENAPPKE